METRFAAEAPARGTYALALGSFAAVLLSWLTIYLTRRETTVAVTPAAVPMLVALLWSGGVLALAGLVLGILAVRRANGSRPLALALASLMLNSATLTFFVIIGWLALVIGN